MKNPTEAIRSAPASSSAPIHPGQRGAFHFVTYYAEETDGFCSSYQRSAAVVVVNPVRTLALGICRKYAGRNLRPVQPQPSGRQTLPAAPSVFTLVAAGYGRQPAAINRSQPIQIPLIILRLRLMRDAPMLAASIPVRPVRPGFFSPPTPFSPCLDNNTQLSAG